jgi:hypothetical protein
MYYKLWKNILQTALTTWTAINQEMTACSITELRGRYSHPLLFSLYHFNNCGCSHGHTWDCLSNIMSVSFFFSDTFSTAQALSFQMEEWLQMVILEDVKVVLAYFIQNLLGKNVEYYYKFQSGYRVSNPASESESSQNQSRGTKNYNLMLSTWWESDNSNWTIFGDIFWI